MNIYNQFPIAKCRLNLFKSYITFKCAYFLQRDKGYKNICNFLNTLDKNTCNHKGGCSGCPINSADYKYQLIQDFYKKENNYEIF